jgi:hypothetical protein
MNNKCTTTGASFCNFIPPPVGVAKIFIFDEKLQTLKVNFFDVVKRHSKMNIEGRTTGVHLGDLYTAPKLGTRLKAAAVLESKRISGHGVACRLYQNYTAIALSNQKHCFTPSLEDIGGKGGSEKISTLDKIVRLGRKKTFCS